MFRGFTRREIHIILACIALIGGGRIVDSARADRQYEFQYSGPAIEHDPGELEADEVSPASEQPEQNGDKPDALIDLNTATVEMFESLPGIGPSKAQDFIQWREQNGGFKSVDDLDQVPGIGEKTVARLRPFVEVRTPPTLAEPSAPVATATSPPTPATPTPPPEIVPSPAAQLSTKPTGPVNINQATAEELDTLDGIGPQLAARIIESRVTQGPFRSIDDLQRVKGIGPKLIERNRHRLTVH